MTFTGCCSSTRPGALSPSTPTGREGAAFFFRHGPLEPEVARDREQQDQLLTRIYGGMAWRVPELLELFRSSHDVYVDRISRVSVDSWSRGRIVLVGDAADCVSLFGEGSSMAILGGATLALALASNPDDPAAAFRRYEQLHRRRLRRPHRGVPIASHVLVPATPAGMSARNAAFRLASALSPADRAR